jgi:hypothetical protein
MNEARPLSRDYQAADRRYAFRWTPPPAGELADAAHEGAAMAADTLGIPVPAIEYFQESNWRAGYHFVRDHWLAGFWASDQPRTIHLRASQATPGDVFHSALHETAHVWQATLPATPAQFAEGPCDALAARLCGELGGPCGHCKRTGPELDFGAMQRARASRPAARVMTAARAAARAQVVMMVGGLTGQALYQALVSAECRDAVVDLGQGRCVSAKDALAAYEKRMREHDGGV